MIEYYEAGVMEVVKSVVTGEFFIIPVVVAALLALFKVIPNDKIYGFFSGAAKKLGVVMTLGLTKYKWTKPFWNKYIEPCFIDLFENTIGAIVAGFIEGLRSDNIEE